MCRALPVMPPWPLREKRVCVSQIQHQRLVQPAVLPSWPQTCEQKRGLLRLQSSAPPVTAGDTPLPPRRGALLELRPREGGWSDTESEVPSGWERRSDGRFPRNAS
ncbi:hypothetical protein NDU88_006931 [Pleurodeles waltl]|uniref:Uncharacterized protein n=1 Tax=Pleurodeles waltl TaxID=8319 RepID=A0AAV7PPX6_PLEWA|nr:hypothetical protein NDU88_006931 [Pleurodeles waltl]